MYHPTTTMLWVFVEKVFMQEKCPEYWYFRDFGTLLMALSKKSVPNAGIFVILGHF